MKVFFTDLDGTLLSPDKNLSDFTRRNLENLWRRGHLITAATARSSNSLKPMFAGLKPPLPFIELGGALITDIVSGENLLVRKMKPPAVKQLIERGQGLNLSPTVISRNGVKDFLTYAPGLSEAHHFYIEERKAAADGRLRESADFSQVLNEEIVYLTWFDRQHILEKIIKASADLSSNISMTMFEDSYLAEHWWLTCHHPLATKQNGIESLLKLKGLEDAEVFVFGDELNDLEMLRSYKNSFAPQNAREEVKAAASEVIGSNEQDGVIRRILTELGEKPV